MYTTLILLKATPTHLQGYNITFFHILCEAELVVSVRNLRIKSLDALFETIQQAIFVYSAQWEILNNIRLYSIKHQCRCELVLQNQFKLHMVLLKLDIASGSLSHQEAPKSDSTLFTLTIDI